MTMDAITHVVRERLRQDDKWGEQTHQRGTSEAKWSTIRERQRELVDVRAKRGADTWLDILLEEVYEAAAEEDAIGLSEELIQVAAVAVAWVEAIRDGRG